MKLPWNKYNSLINSFTKDNFKAQIIWRRYTDKINRHGEDDDDPQYTEFLLEGMVQFNDFRTWPITKFTLTGAEDKQSEVLWLSKSYLESNDLLDGDGRFTYNSPMDIFVHEGIEYKDAGSTSTAQSLEDSLLYFIILKRING